MEPVQQQLTLAHYETVECVTDLTIDWDNQTVWATQRQIADLFGVQVPAIAKHLKNIYASNELDPMATISKMEIVQVEGDRKIARLIEHYNLDVILAVGYRVSSKKASDFRKWTTEILRDYIVEGFAINEQRLAQDQNALKNLAAKVRKLRSDEKNIYTSVRDVFAFGSTNYDPSSRAAQGFFAKLQDKFLFAITGHPAQEIVLERADHRQPNMGLQSMKGDRPAFGDITTGKNYLTSDELYGLHILCEQFLLFVESRSWRGQPLTMEEMSKKFDELLVVQGHPIFKEYKGYLVQRAKDHACKELERYRKRLEEARRDNKLAS